MAFGNKLGVSIRGCLKPEEAFAPGFGNLVAEVAPEDTDAVKEAMEKAGLRANVSIVGSVLEEREFRYGDVKIDPHILFPQLSLSQHLSVRLRSSSFHLHVSPAPHQKQRRLS